MRDTTLVSQDRSPAVEIEWKTSAMHAGARAESVLSPAAQVTRHVGNSPESIRTCSLQFMLQNKHAKIFRDTT